VTRFAADVQSYAHMPWMHAKLTLALGVIVLHHIIGGRAKRVAGGSPDAGKGAQILLLATLVCAAGAVWLGVAKHLPCLAHASVVRSPGLPRPERTLDFWFDYSCPYAYLASTQVEALAARTGAALVWKPMLLGGVFAANGTPQKLFATLSPAKAAHNARDLERWAEVFGVELHMPAGHPFRTVEALRATVACGIDPRLVHALYRAYWVLGRPPSDEAILRDAIGAAGRGHEADRVLAAIARPEAKDDLRRRTDEAIALGIFGAPAFVVDGARLYWGQDRMDFVERDLRQPHEPQGAA
jgi:2-hydroxychromene-2-carboxylate isomerase